jgi:putative heme-binding domain-containing protein
MALPLLSASIQDSSVNSSERLKFFRAFDFINAPQKESVLLGLLKNTGPNRNEILLTALNHLSPSSLAKSPKMQSVLKETLTSVKGTQNFVDLVGRYNLKNYNNDLMQIAVSMPDSSLGSDAANLLVKLGGSSLLKNAINSKDQITAKAALKTLSSTGTNEGIAMVESIIKDKSVDLGMRQEAVKLLASGWNESERLLNMVKEGKLPNELKPIAAVALSNAYRKDIKQESLKYLQVADSAGGKSLPPINELAKLSGNSISGKQTFSTICATCHKIDNEGENFGPALSKIGSKLTKEALYLSIIHPDEGISFGYEGHVFKLKDGNVAAGIITSETEEAVEIVMPGGIKKTYEKPIASRTQMKNSMMPSGLHQTITQQQLVDLVEYLHGKE